MITSARIEAVKELGGIGWITCLCAPAIRKLAADDAPLQMSVLDQQDLAELSHPDYPGERLIADRNPYLAAERHARDFAGRKDSIAGQVSAGRVSGAGDRRGLDTGLVRTVSNDAVNCPARSRTRNRKSAARSPRSIAVQEEEAEGVVPLAHVIRDIAASSPSTPSRAPKRSRPSSSAPTSRAPARAVDRTATELR